MISFAHKNKINPIKINNFIKFKMTQYKKTIIKKICYNNDMQKNKNYLDELNPAQRQAAEFNNGPLLVIAGAGSGKTKTLVYRVVRLVELGIEPERILLLTFTRKSAQEMLERASNVLDQRCNNVSGGTFHAFASITLRKYAKHIGFAPEFTILDRSDAENLIQLIRKKYKTLIKEKRFPKKSTLMDIISKQSNTNVSIRDSTTRYYPQFSDIISEIEDVATSYAKQKQEMQVMDYDDLLSYLNYLLKNNETVRKELQNKFDYIMVDEYQDTNHIQANILHYLLNEQQNIMVVGDDSQSIYSFRGANFKNIMTFPKRYPNAQKIMLEQNYRSTEPILKLTNALISHASEKFTKNLFTDKKSNTKPKYIECKSEYAQAEYICKEILKIRETISLNKIAILIRSGWHSNQLEIALKSHNLPFVKYGGFKFIESAHVKDAISFFKLLVNPKDMISWNRLLVLYDKIGPKSIQIFGDILKQNQYRLDPLLIQCLPQKPAFEGIKPLLNFFIKLSNLEQSPSQLLHPILAFYQNLFQQNYDDYKKRESDLESLEGICKQYNNINDMLTQFSLDPPQSQENIADKFNDENITISTIHSAKGLEWHTVFILSAIDGYIPSMQAMGDLAQLEEERRLMYVALTRAEESLYIMKPNINAGSYRTSYAGMSFAKPSRFLEEHNVLNDFTQTVSTDTESNQSYRNISSNCSDDSNVLFSSKGSESGIKYSF